MSHTPQTDSPLRTRELGVGGAVVRGLPGPDVRAFSFGFGLDRLGSHRPGRLPRKKTKKTKQKQNHIPEN